MPTQDRFRYTVITGTNSGTANTEVAFAHGLGTIPDFYYILNTFLSGAGVVYESKAADATNIYLRATVASTPFRAMCFVGVS